ncbi:MAG: PEGA domain-containing protein [Candidatus Cloacimonetes bacterium]|nr:PEGA domain-containing protein [Candidatus Cloacimonadota bacterium]
MRGRRYLVIILFIICMVNSMSGQGLNQLSIVGKATRPSGEIVPGDKLDANKNQAALISFITDLDVDMDFKPWNGAVGEITNPAMGRWNVYVSPGERAIDVHAEGFKPLKVVLSSFGINSVKSGDVYHLEITGEKKAEQIPVMISSNQSGADVYIDGEFVGTTQNKMLTVSVNQGEREIKITKDGFASQSITEDVSVTNNSFNFNLEPAYKAVVKITSEPEGATVTIDSNMNLGVTPVQSFYDAGTYPVRIEKENYDTIDEQITIIEPETVKHYIMTDIRATLTVKTHAKATVKFNGKDYIGGIDKLVMLPQTVNFKIEQEFCETIEETYTLKKGENKVFELYPENISATLTIITAPEATVIFNGKDYIGGIDKLVMLPQTVNFKIEQKFCETIDETYTMKKGEKKVFELYPENILASITIITAPEAIVTYSGKEYKGGIDKLEMMPQTISFKIEQEFCDTIEETYILKKSEEKTFELYPENVMASLTINTSPQSTVILNGQSYEGGIDELVMPPQTISFKIEQEFCETIKETYVLEKGEKKVFELFPEDIGAILSVMTYANATVKFNGESFIGGGL